MLLVERRRVFFPNHLTAGSDKLAPEATARKTKSSIEDQEVNRDTQV